MASIDSKTNLDYQAAPSPLGGSYTENKFRRLQLPDLAGRAFLDLGCNAGYYCEYALHSGAARVVGVDADPKVIAQARQKLPGVEFHDGGWDNDFPSGPFDVVILLSAVHYAVDPVAVTSKVYRETRPGALLVVEGGLIDPSGVQRSDVLVPGWRKVGDRCRHLSHGYLRNHMLTHFDWRVVGDSEPRGGDDVARYVVHAIRSASRPRHGSHTLDLVEYAAGIAMSADTVVDAQPASAYLRRWRGGAPRDATTLHAVLSEPSLFEGFVTDLAWALEPSKSLPVDLCAGFAPDLTQAVANALESRGFVIRRA
jgi:SAM-dependent methyltransferase